MDKAQVEEIIRQHGPHISTSNGLATGTTQSVCRPTSSSGSKTPCRVRFKGSQSAEESGPPSPTEGAPPNFSVVATGIFRSAFPYKSNLDFLISMRFRTIVTLVTTEFDLPTATWLASSGIKHYRIPIPAHKDGKTIPMADLAQIMRIITNPCNQPILIHCNKGKHRTGCVVASFRALAAHNERTDWAAPGGDFIAEYVRHSEPKQRQMDVEFIQGLSPRDLYMAMAAIEEPVKPITAYGTDR